WPRRPPCSASGLEHRPSRDSTPTSERLIRRHPFSVRLLEVGLIGAVGAAVLAFGGTLPSFFALTQVMVLGLGVLFLLRGQFSPSASIRFPVGPLLLIAL